MRCLNKIEIKTFFKLSIMTLRQKRTQQFHKEVYEAYVLRIVDFVENHKNKQDIICLMSNYKGLTLELIDKYPDVAWDWGKISWNPNLTLEWLDKYPDKSWDWYVLSDNNNLHINWYEQYPNKP